MRRHDLLHIAVEPVEHARLIHAAGEIDMSTVAQLRRELDAARDQAAAALLDLRDVTFIDSSGLHLLEDASRSSALTDWPFFIVRPSETVRRLIELTGTRDVLHLVEPATSLAGPAWASE